MAYSLLPAPPTLLAGLLRGSVAGVRSVSAAPSDLRRWVLLRGSRYNYQLPPVWVFVVPVLFVALFAVLIVPANLVLANWTVELFDSLGTLAQQMSPWRIIFWIIAGLLIYGFFRIRLGRRRSPRKPPRAITPSTLRALDVRRACVLSLIGLNGLYLCANLVDVAYLWMSFELPSGMTYAEFAQKGSYRLIVAVVLAALAFTVAFPDHSMQLCDRLTRRLAYLFVLQNLFVLASAARRLGLYVEVYGLTRFRVSVVFWMLLVAVGFITILVRLWGQRPLITLFRQNAVTTLLLLTAVSLANIDGWIADWNVDRYEQGSSIAVDLRYLASLEAAALPAIARLTQVASEKNDDETAASARRVLSRRLRDETTHRDQWRTWSWRRERSVVAAQKLLDEG
jgi:hypothetical protein